MKSSAARHFSFIVLLVAAGCSGNVVYTDTSGDDVGNDAVVQDTGTEDDAGDVVVFPDMGGNGTVSATLPSAEMAVRITTPSNRGYYATQAGTVALGGIYFGNLESIVFEAEGVTGGQVISDPSSPYWQTAAISLKPGDNLITVIARGRGDRDDVEQPPVTVRDSIVITYNPNMYFPAPMRMSPPTVFSGRTQAVLAKVNMGLFGTAAGDRMYVVRQFEDGRLSENLGGMSDGGMVNGSADEIQGDGVFTGRVTVKCDAVGTQLYRAALEVTSDSGSYVALSAPFELRCIENIDSATCSAHKETLSKATKAFMAKVDAGMPEQARAAAFKVIAADTSIAETSQSDESGGGIWVRFNDGVLGALNLYAEGQRGGGGSDVDEVPVSLRAADLRSLDRNQISSRETLLLAPFFTEFGRQDEIPAIAEIVSEINCPVFTLKGPYLGSGASLEKFRQLSTSGIIAISTHSDVYFAGLSGAVRAGLPWRHRGGQEILWSGESVNCGRIGSSDQECESSADCPAGSTCIITDPPEEYTEQVETDAGIQQVTKMTKPSGTCYDTTHADLMSGRLVMGDRNWGVTPEFVEYYADEQRLPGSLVYLGGCRTLYNGSLAMALLASGARTVLGYTNRVSSEFAFKSGRDFFFNFLLRTLSASESYGGGDVDPDNPGGFFRLFGALDLSVKYSNILNPGFETSDAAAWVTQGDGRVITRLGETEPIAGKFMGIISTGLGFTDKTGTISQSFCIPAGARELVFYWKYYSEEFHEFCGTLYQDAFVARLTTKDGTEYPVVDIKVDDLCAKDGSTTPPELCFEYEGSCDPEKCTNKVSGKLECRKYHCEADQCGSKFVGLEPSDIDFDRGDTYMTGWQKAVFPLDAFDPERDAPVTISFYCTDKGDSIFDTAVLVDSVSFR